MHNPDIKKNMSFLSDIQSQRLCLEDALKSRSKSAMLHALQAVGDAPANQKFARELDLCKHALSEILAGPDEDHPVLITQLIGRLLAIIEAEQLSAAAKMTKSRRVPGKTGRNDKG